MEKDSNISISTHDDCSGTVVQSVRDMHPAHYILKIDSFSFLVEMLKECGSKSYESEIFEASGHKWKLTLYPNGDKKRNGKSHISIYLSIQDTDKLSLGWDVYAEYKFFVLDQIRDKYSIFQDIGKRVRRFHEYTKEWGFARLITRNVFDNATNGYLIQDKCVFGVEILVCNYNVSGECLVRPEKLISNSTYAWKVTNFSASPKFYSPVFNIGNFNWKVLILRKGSDGNQLKSVWAFLELEDMKNTSKVYANYKLSIKDQNNAILREYKSSHLFTATSKFLDWHGFVLFKDIEDAFKGFLMQHTMIVEVEFTRISTVKCFS